MDKPPPRPRGPPPKPKEDSAGGRGPPRPRGPAPPRGPGGPRSPPPRGPGGAAKRVSNAAKPPPGIPPPKKQVVVASGAKVKSPPTSPPLPTGKPRPRAPLPVGAPPKGPPLPAASPPKPRAPIPAGSPKSPPKPRGQPPKPSAGPPKPAGQPPRPSGGPPKPAGQPPRPSGGPPKPAGQPPRPSGGPPRPAGQPPRPGGRPPRPLGRPPGKPAAPPGRPPAPAGRPPAPAGRPPAPAGRPPAPAGRPPPPATKPLPPSSSVKGSKPGPPSAPPPPRGRASNARPPPPGIPPPSDAATVRKKPPPPQGPPAASLGGKTPPPPNLPPPPEMDGEENPAFVPPPPDDPEDLRISDDDAPPPDETDNLFDAPPIPLPTLVPGRFTIEVIEGFDLKKHDAAAAITATKIDPYIKTTLGSHKKAPNYKGRVHKNQGKLVNFQEIIVLNMINPEMFVAENDIKLHLTIMNSNILADTVLGQADVSVLPLLVEFEVEKEFPLYFQKRKSDPKERAGGVKLRIRFQPARCGYLQITCKEGRKMKNMEMMGKQDPYCKFELANGQKPKRTKTIKNGGTACSFNDEIVTLWIDSQTWTQDLKFSCFDEDIGTDDLIGARLFDILEFVTDAHNMEDFKQEGLGRVHEEWFEIFQGKKLDKLSGEILLGIQFFPSGTLTITSIEGRHLVDKDTMGRQDPYIVYTMKSDNEIAHLKEKTKTDTDGGTDPRWDEKTIFPIVDHHEITMEVYDEDQIGSDDLIGKASFSLLPLFKKGVIDTWITLKNKDNWGRVTKCGEVHLNLDFRGPPGVAYPMFQPDMDTFDDSERVNNEKADDEEDDKNKGNDGDDGRPLGLSDEFSDEDIEHAFRFIDLNKNGFIGSSEIRHILICMGELITDEEVDEMIRMVDSDGDGQVSFEEFYALMVHPDPSVPSFDPDQVLRQVGKAVALGPDAKELAAKREANEAVKKEKMHLMNIFSKANEVTMPSLQRAFDKFRLIDRGTGSTGFVDYTTMCDVLLVEPTGEIQKMFKLFDPYHSGRIHMRELLLGLSNFAQADHEARCNFCFSMFDEDGSGQLDEKELTQIVKALNYATDEATVRKKVETILKQCDEDGSGQIDRTEFVVTAKKFPNLLFSATKPENR